jgi:hypothetical protein
VELMKDPILKRPCDNCPFRNDRPGFLSRGRARSLIADMRFGKHFLCHKTLDYDVEECPAQTTEATKICAGYVLLAENIRASIQIVRLAERFGFHDPAKKDRTSPVHRTAEDFIKAQY